MVPALGSRRGLLVPRDVVGLGEIIFLAVVNCVRLQRDVAAHLWKLECEVRGV